MAIVEFDARSERAADGTWLVSVAGDLDLHTAPELERALLSATGDGAGTVVVDLSGCTFLDSTGLHILVGVRRRLDGGAVKIVGAAPAVRRPFEVTGLDRLFRFYPTRTAALDGGR